MKQIQKKKVKSARRTVDEVMGKRSEPITNPQTEQTRKILQKIDRVIQK